MQVMKDLKKDACSMQRAGKTPRAVAGRARSARKQSKSVGRSQVQVIKRSTVADHWARLKHERQEVTTKDTGEGHARFPSKSVLGLRRRDTSKGGEVIGTWPAGASCIMFVLLPKAVESDKPIEF